VLPEWLIKPSFACADISYSGGASTDSSDANKELRYVEPVLLSKTADEFRENSAKLYTMVTSA